MPDIRDFTPLRAETILSIRARVDSDTNAGVDPVDPAFLDTIEGGVQWDMTQGVVIECERLWDFAATEVVAASFPAYAWGEYLDAHGDTLNLLRKDAVAATGEITITGDAGSPVATGISVATQRIDPDADPIVFQTAAPMTIAASPGPAGLAAVATGTGGTLPPTTYYYVVSAIIPNPNVGQPGQPATLETVISNEATATTPTGNTAKVTLTWTARASATGYNVYRGAAIAGETLLATVGAVLTYVDTGAAGPGSQLPPTNRVPIVALNSGVEGNVSAGAISQLLSPVAGVASIANASNTSGGADVESDDLYRDRILLEYSTPQGAGNQGDYIRWALGYDPVGFATIDALWNGAGTVRVIVTDQQNNPVSAAVIAGLQTQLDPVPGTGAGLAPIGAIVTVATPAILTITVSATVTLFPGYSLDGTGGLIAVRADIVASIQDYVDSLKPGDDVILEHVKARFFAVAGVKDISAVTLNGSATNVPVGPPGAIQVASLGTVTLA